MHSLLAQPAATVATPECPWYLLASSLGHLGYPRGPFLLVPVQINIFLGLALPSLPTVVLQSYLLHFYYTNWGRGEVM